MAVSVPAARRTFTGAPGRSRRAAPGDVLGGMRSPRRAWRIAPTGPAQWARRLRTSIVRALRRSDDAPRTARSLKIWRNTEPGAGSVVEWYLASRGLSLDQWPTSLRFHPRCSQPKGYGNNFIFPLPAMVALVEHVERGPVAVHCTYLRPDGGAKADVEKPKAIFGPVAGGAVRFGAPHAGQWLAVAEGIETALSVAVACSMPAWAALSAGGIKNLRLLRVAKPSAPGQ